jgi:2'-hydroxyisoflavone reductase
LKTLILGGTRFVGRHIAEALLQAGYEVTVFTRGKTSDELPTSVERLHGDRNEGLEGLQALRGREWDACVDVCGYTPKQVRPSAELLADHVGRYVFISTASVYAEGAARPVTEDAPRHAPASEEITKVDLENYGPLKVTCEDIVTHVYGERATLIRPQIVVGPHDPSGRYPYWVHRAIRGGPMLVPGDGSDHVQVIDARDQARFVIRCIEHGIGGAFNTAGPRFTWSEFVRLLGVEDVAWVPTLVLEEAGVLETLQLFVPDEGPWGWVMDQSNERAVAAGLTLSDPAETLRAVIETLPAENALPLLDPAREAELIAQVRR